jgi:hypothetical protein
MSFMKGQTVFTKGQKKSRNTPRTGAGKTSPEGNVRDLALEGSRVALDKSLKKGTNSMAHQDRLGCVEWKEKVSLSQVGR